MSILARIVGNKQKEVAATKTRMSIDSLTRRKEFGARAFDFHESLHGKGLNLIAEIKRSSPSKGVLADNLEPGITASAYETAGADALSVLTDKEFFGGGLEDLVAARAATELPILRKDFVIDEYQIYEAKAYGADAVLLIAGLAEENTLAGYLEVCREIGIAALVEAHSAEEVKKALAAGAGIVGINNRDLRTFKVDLAVTENLMPDIPGHVTKISESGIKNGREAGRARAAGADAVLVGEALITADDLESRVAEIRTV